MNEIKLGDKVVLRGRVVVRSASDVKVLVAAATQGARRVWIHKNSLIHDVSPSPVTVKCDKCGVERPLTDFKTALTRAAALGLPPWGAISSDDFVRFCAQLAEKGVTAEQFNEGLTDG